MVEKAETRRWFTLLYCAALLLVVVPLFGFAQAYPVHLRSPTWRASLVGLAGSTLIFPLLGLLSGAVGARLLGHRWVLKGFALVLALLGLGLLASLPVFTLDVLQLRHNLVMLQGGGVLKQRAMIGFEINSARAVAQCGLLGLVAVYAAWVGWRDGRLVQKRERRVKSTESAAQLVGAVRRAVQ